MLRANLYVALALCWFSAESATAAVAPILKLDCQTARPCQGVSLRGTGFAANESLPVRLCSTTTIVPGVSCLRSTWGRPYPIAPAYSGKCVTIGTTTTTATGDLSQTCRIPGNLPPGSYQLQVGGANVPLIVRADWPQLGGDQAHRGAIVDETILDASTVGAVRQAWSVQLTGDLVAQAIEKDGILVAASTSGKLAALDPANGHPLWTFQTTGASRLVGSPAAHGDSICVAAEDGAVYVLSLGKGELLWKASVPAAVTGSVTAGNGFYIPASNGRVYAFPATCKSASCAPLWNVAAPAAITGAATIVNELLYVGTTRGDLVAFNLAECSLGPAACAPCIATNLGAPISGTAASFVDDPRFNVLFVAAGRTACAFHPYAKAKVSPTTPVLKGLTQGAITSSPAFDTRPVPGKRGSSRFTYVGDETARLYCFRVEEANISSGAKPQWTFQASGPVRGAMVLANGVLFAVSEDGYLYALDIVRGTLLLKAALSAPSTGSPMVVNGTIFVGDSKGVLHAFQRAGQ